MRFRSAGYEELDPGDHGNQLPQHEKDGRFWVFVLTLIEGVDHNHGGNICRLEWFDQKLFHLVLKRLVDNVWVGSEERDKLGSEGRVLLRKLECQRWEDELEITAILDTPRAEVRRSQTTIGKNLFCNRLRDGGFSRPGESVEPEDWRLVEILGPPLDLVQHALPGSPQATAPIPVLISGPVSATATIQDYHIGFEICKSASFTFIRKESDLDPVELSEMLAGNHFNNSQSIEGSGHILPAGAPSRPVA
jgi:hypothetical protein